MEIRAYHACDLDESCTPIYSNKSNLPQSPNKPSAQVRGHNSPRRIISYFQKQRTLLLKQANFFKTSTVPLTRCRDGYFLYLPVPLFPSKEIL